jgi:hypothetical protein
MRFVVRPEKENVSPCFETRDGCGGRVTRQDGAMNRLAGVLALAVLQISCSGPSVPSDQGGGANLRETRPEAMRSPGWLDLRTLGAHTDAEVKTPSEPYIRGVWVGGLFYPEGEVVGAQTEPPAKRIVVKGWLAVTTRAFYPESLARKPRAPRIAGWRDKETGNFYPASTLDQSVDVDVIEVLAEPTPPEGGS